MKTHKFFLITITTFALYIFSTVVVFGQQPPHPGGGGPTGGDIPVGGGAPIDGGLIYFLLLGFSYGTKKIINAIKKNQ